MCSLKMIDKYELQEKLERVISDYLKGRDIIFVDLNFHAQGRKLILRILVDHPNGGITLDECARLNEEMGRLIEREDIVKQSYILEVFSPGIDRPLLSRDDFFRCLNRRVRIFFNQCQAGKYEISGEITSITETGLNLDSEGEIRQIQFDQIKKAKQAIG